MSGVPGTAIRLAGTMLGLLVLGALASHLGVAGNFSASSAPWPPLANRSLMRCVLADAGGSLALGRAARARPDGGRVR